MEGDRRARSRELRVEFFGKIKKEWSEELSVIIYENAPSSIISHDDGLHDGEESETRRNVFQFYDNVNEVICAKSAKE